MLSKICNISVCTIKRIENNQNDPDINTCKILATGLNINVDILYDAYQKFIISDYASSIKKYRKNTNLTQQQLADKLCISKKTLSCWERRTQYPSRQMYSTIMHLLSE